jgi:hypothetical protein
MAVRPCSQVPGRFLLEQWQAKALESFPRLEEEINRNEGGPLSLWGELYLALVKAYEEHPINEDLIGKIYDYAAWCFSQPQTDDVGTDLSSAAAVGLIESIPLDKRVSDDLYRWLSLETFVGCESLFRYHLSDEDYRKFSDEFIRKKKDYSGPSRL